MFVSPIENKVPPVYGYTDFQFNSGDSGARYWAKKSPIIPELSIVPLENKPHSGDNTPEMLNSLEELKQAHLCKDTFLAREGSVPVRKDAIGYLKGHLKSVWAEMGEVPLGDVGADGMGGAEIVWETDNRTLILSATASIPDQLPDVYLLVIDRQQTDRNKKYVTIRPTAGQSFPKQIAKYLTWLTNPTAA